MIYNVLHIQAVLCSVRVKFERETKVQDLKKVTFVTDLNVASAVPFFPFF